MKLLVAEMSKYYKRREEMEQIQMDIGRRYQRKTNPKGEVTFFHSDCDCGGCDVEVGIVGARPKITIGTYARGKGVAHRSSTKGAKNPHKKMTGSFGGFSHWKSELGSRESWLR